MAHARTLHSPSDFPCCTLVVRKLRDQIHDGVEGVFVLRLGPHCVVVMGPVVPHLPHLGRCLLDLAAEAGGFGEDVEEAGAVGCRDGEDLGLPELLAVHPGLLVCVVHNGRGVLSVAVMGQGLEAVGDTVAKRAGGVHCLGQSAGGCQRNLPTSLQLWWGGRGSGPQALSGCTSSSGRGGGRSGCP